MSRRCRVTRRQPEIEKSVSHSHHRTSRRWNSNIQSRRFWEPSLGRTVRSQVSVKGLPAIDKRGIDALARDLATRGVRL